MSGPAPPGPPGRPPRRRRMLAVGVGVLLLGAAAVLGRAAPWERLGAPGPRPARDGQAAAGPLPGVPLRGASGLRLLVSGDSSLFVLDVDTGAV